MCGSLVRKKRKKRSCVDHEQGHIIGEGSDHGRRPPQATRGEGEHAKLGGCAAVADEGDMERVKKKIKNKLTNGPG